MTADDSVLQERLLALAKLQPVFEDPEFRFGHWPELPRLETGAFQMPYVQLSAGGEAFIETAYRHGWVVPGLDWPAWSQSTECDALQHQPEALGQASPDQLARLITTLVRADRFTEGTLLGASSSGLLLRILKRAHVLLTGLATTG